MDFSDFISQCAGKWFSQRTSHAIPPQALEAGTCDFWIDLIEPGDASLRERCQTIGIDPAHVTCAIRTHWQGQVGTANHANSGATFSLFVPSDTPQQGQFWRWSEDHSDSPVIQGHYHLGEDNALNLSASTDSLSSEERLWFLNPNLRERTSVVTHKAGPRYASFCSEIRMGLK
ncbi:phycobiliprotein lyase [Geitlerinema sp. P-1104]|uniref:phycobiliprotein lyase n=1 Tax=Geitlerinema sp. P-1104 TaxID=2546230 RepID=UPI0014769984|nr:phycobiliprotein lyase [Geitlerinema sp. P-1104]NMG57890.1 phycobiliprotein lyase [Geitlerinema sp. P-1104]